MHIRGTRIHSVLDRNDISAQMKYIFFSTFFLRSLPAAVTDRQM